MAFADLIPVKSAQSLRRRLVFFKRRADKRPQRAGAAFFRAAPGASFAPTAGERGLSPMANVTGFLDLVSASLSSVNSDAYLFGGLLRDIAMFGQAKFDSDIDVVIEGDWGGVVPLLLKRGAQKNKYGGYRLTVGGWPMDIWHARDTWAIKQGLARYDGIASLTKTTILNWDAILMNWRGGNLIYPPGYFEAIQQRTLDIVLLENPNPIGMLVKVLRHLHHKDAQTLTPRAVQYLRDATATFSYEDTHAYEVGSYGNAIIPRRLHGFARSGMGEGSSARGLATKGRAWGDDIRDELAGQACMRL